MANLELQRLPATAEEGVSNNLREQWQLLTGVALILAVAFLLRLYAALRFPNIHFPDEVFQYLEQAHRLVFGYGIIPWEYRDGARSWLVPGFLGVLLKISDLLGLSQPEIYSFLVSATLSALSLSVVVVGFLWAFRTQGAFAGLITAALCAVWFELIYFAPKTLTEPIAAHILVIAVYLAYPSQPTTNKHRLFAAGLLFGLVVAIRLSLAPALLVAAVYICRSQIRNKWIPLVLGGLVTFALAGILDAFTWQYPFQSFASNFWVNIVEQKSQNYGIERWYYFAMFWLYMWKGAIVPVTLLCLFAVRKNLLLGLIAFTIILTHTLIVHKEYRFVFPALPFVIILVGLGTAEVFDYVQKDLNIKNQKLLLTVRAGIVLGWAVISGVLASSYNFRHYWFKWAGEIQAFHLLYKKSDLCGIGLIDLPWGKTGGYAHLHRNIPIIIPEKNIAASFSAYNYALANPRELPDYWPYSEVICWSDDEMCVYHREGPCESAPDLEVNNVVRRRGQ
jgi:phosphatidylinositol glycan class B